MLRLPDTSALAAAAVCVLLAAFAVSTPAVNAEASELVVRCTNSDGEPVRPSRAELLTSGWGYADGIALETKGDAVVLPLDEAGLNSLVGEDAAQIDELFLYIEAPGYAPVRSAPFVPPAKWAEIPGEAKLGFPGGAGATLTRDKATEVDVVLRKRAQRRLLLLDENGPVPGVTVSTYMYWSSSNHCARLSGARLVGTAVSDADGVVEVPDGDYEYAFEIAADDMGLVLADPELPEYPERLVTTLQAERTVVKLHRRKSVTLSVRVLKNGVTVAGQTLYGCLADCPGGVCASCCGPLSASGPYGVITIPGFYPEAYKSIYIPDADGEKLFEADPQKLSLKRPIEVDLAVCAIQGSGM